MSPVPCLQLSHYPARRSGQKLCEGNRIEGVIRFGHSWMVPKDAKKPVDLRMKKYSKNGGPEDK